MITVANRIFVTPEFSDAFEGRFRERAGRVDTMPGFLFNQVLRPTKVGDPYIVLTLWESIEHFQAWVGSDAFKEGHAKSGSLPRAAFGRKNELEIHQVIQDSRDPELVAGAPITLETAHG